MEQQRVKKTRGRIACRRCNERRVRCDASTAGIPCSSCVAVKASATCRLIDSKRARGEQGRFSSTRTLAATGSTTAPVDSCDPPKEHPTSNSESKDAHVTDATSLQPAPSPEDADQWSQLLSTKRPSVANGGRVVYLGESWTLSYVSRLVPQENTVSPPNELHQALPPESEEVLQPASSSTKDLEKSVTSTSDDLPPLDIQSALIDAYFAYDHTLYPVIAQSDFRDAFRSGTVSKLLLLSVFYAGALHVDDAVVYRICSKGRLDCLQSFYTRAKAVFDADSERDRVSVVQSAYLLHNWWQHPNATMDPWTWLGLAIRLAQNLGMHRSTDKSPLSPSDRSLYKRIWWCLYSRDRQCASALGKPFMIRDVDCDVEPLTVDDFEPNDSVDSRLFVIEQARLATLFGSVISCQFAPGLRDDAKRARNRDRLEQSLLDWRTNLPLPLQYRRDGSGSFYALLIQVLLNCLMILLYRPNVPPKSSNIILNEETSIAFDAANSTTKIAETIMNYHSLLHCPLYCTSAIFSAMTMHVIRGSEADHQLSLCMIAMRTLSTMYPAAGWIRNMFQKFNEKKQSVTLPRRPSPHLANTKQHQPQAQQDRAPAGGIFPRPVGHKRALTDSDHSRFDTPSESSQETNDMSVNYREGSSNLPQAINAGSAVAARHGSVDQFASPSYASSNEMDQTSTSPEESVSDLYVHPSSNYSLNYTATMSGINSQGLQHRHMNPIFQPMIADAAGMTDWGGELAADAWPPGLYSYWHNLSATQPGAYGNGSQ